MKRKTMRKASMHEGKEKSLMLQRFGILNITDKELEGENLQIEPSGVLSGSTTKRNPINENMQQTLGVISERESQKDSENEEIISQNENEDIFSSAKRRDFAKLHEMELAQPPKKVLQTKNIVNHEDLNKFTDELFGTPNGMLNFQNEKEKEKKEEKIQRNLRSQMSYEIVDVEEYDNVPQLCDVLPKVKRNEIVMNVPFSSISSNKSIETLHNSKKDENNKQEGVVFRNNMQNTQFGTKMSTMSASPTEKITEKQKDLKNKPSEIEKMEVEEKLPENAQMAAEEDTAEIKYKEKFILKLGDISIGSSLDVLLQKNKHGLQLVSHQAILQLLPPYKVKIKYEPTEFPFELIVVEDNDTVKDGQSIANTSVNQNADSVSVNSKISGGSKVIKKRIRRKKKGKRGSSKKGDTESRISSKKESSKKVSPRAPSIAGSKRAQSKPGSSRAGASVATKGNEKALVEIEEEKKVEEKLTIPQQLQKLRDEDSSGKKPLVQWSGQEVLENSDPNAAVWITDNLCAVHLWHHGLKGLLACTQFWARKIVLSELIENFMNLLVLINTVTLAMDRYGQPTSEADALSTLNIVFTSVFTAEMAIKIFGMGPTKYLSDSLNILDGFVVIISWAEIIFLGGSGAFSSFRTLRVLRLVRTIRVVRVARLLRSFHSIHVLTQVMQSTIGSFGYIGLLLLIIMCIYSLFGMQMFGGKWNFPDGLPRPNYDSFNNAFISVFQLLTVENWPSLLWAGLRNEFGPLVALYFVSFLFIGNYILLNLFLAIMLDAFAEVEEQERKENEDETEVMLNVYLLMLGRRLNAY